MTAAETIESLPGFLREVAEAAGLEAARDLARSCGGSIIYVPERLGRRETLLIQAVGREAAAKICRLRPRENVLVPMGPFSSEAEKRAKIRQLLEEGVAVQEIVRRLGVHRVTVYRVKQAADDARQFDLFKAAD